MSHDLRGRSPQVPKTTVIPFELEFFDIFQRGFLYARHEALVLRLPEQYSAWEDALARAETLRLKRFDQSEAAKAWRRSINEVGETWLIAIVQTPMSTEPFDFS
jgi:hypothetical protein